MGWYRIKKHESIFDKFETEGIEGVWRVIVFNFCVQIGYRVVKKGIPKIFGSFSVRHVS